MNGQGNKPCGRTVLGPFSWGHMGDNTDLDPKNKTAWGAVWLRTSAARISTTFATLGALQDLVSPGTPPPPPSPPPSVIVEVLGEDLSVEAVSKCTTTTTTDGHPAAGSVEEGHYTAMYGANVPRTVVVECEVGNSGVEKHLGLRFSGAKQFREYNHKEGGSGLLWTSFS